MIDLVIMMEYQLIRSKRKTLSLEIGKNGEIIVRAPLCYSSRRIEEFVRQHSEWIEKHELLWKKRQANLPDESKTEEYLRRAQKELPLLVEKYSKLMCLEPQKVTITKAKTRFGSCSDQNRICFSCYLMAYPPEAVEYVVVHELAHIRFHHHQKDFYNLIAEYLPDYKKRIRLLRG